MWQPCLVFTNNNFHPFAMVRFLEPHFDFGMLLLLVVVSVRLIGTFLDLLRE
jgi:hypothetical protein